MTKTLEDHIMSCWQLVNELEVVFQYVVEPNEADDKPDQDKLANMILGLTQLYELKFDALLEAHEADVKKRWQERQPAVNPSEPGSS